MVVHSCVSEVSYICSLRWRGFEEISILQSPLSRHTLYLGAQKHRDFFRSNLPETETETEPVPAALRFCTDTVTGEVQKNITLNNVSY